MANGNKEYRSDVFSMLLQDKRRALEIYNAINETVYDDPEQVEFTTLGAGCFSLSIRNDASFIFDAKLSIYEHQSTKRFFYKTTGGGNACNDIRFYI